MKFQTACLAIAIIPISLVAGPAPVPDASFGGLPGGGGFQIGLGHEQTERAIVIGGTEDDLLDVNLTLGYVAYEATSWLTLMVAGGTGDTDESYLGLGLHLALIDMPTENETFEEANLRVAARISYGDFEGARAGLALAWDDIRVDLIVGYDMVAIDRGTLGPDRRYHTFIYGGLVNSTIDGTSGGTTAFEESESFGWTAGLETGWRDRLTFGIQITVFEELSAGGSLGYRF
jgi:hypothetical protein